MSERHYRLSDEEIAFVAQDIGPRLLPFLVDEKTVQTIPVVQKLVADCEKHSLELGRIKTLQEILLRHLSHRFGKVPPSIRQQIEATTEIDSLNRWLDQLLEAHSLMEMDFMSQSVLDNQQ